MYKKTQNYVFIYLLCNKVNNVEKVNFHSNFDLSIFLFIERFIQICMVVYWK